MITRQELRDKISETFDSALELIDTKNADYASEEDGLKNFKGAAIVGVTLEQGILVRVLDKITRISNLLERENKVKDESLSDSIVDAINYLAILKVKVEHGKK